MGVLSPTHEAKKKKKKKKHRKHSSNQSPSRGHVTKAAPAAANMSSEEIGSEMNQIDQFLATLKMGTSYDAILTESTATPTQTKTTTTTVPKTIIPPTQTTTTTAVPKAITPPTQTTTKTAQSAPDAAIGQQKGKSLGLQLIGQFQSSSSSDSDSDSSSDDDISMVMIE